MLKCGCLRSCRTALVQDVQQLAEDALVGLSVRVSDEDVHVTARGLPSTVGATGHHLQAWVYSVSGIPHLPEREKKGRKEGWDREREKEDEREQDKEKHRKKE